MKVMIGVDPDKGSRTATMLERHEHEVALITMRAGRWQAYALTSTTAGRALVEDRLRFGPDVRGRPGACVSSCES